MQIDADDDLESDDEEFEEDLDEAGDDASVATDDDEDDEEDSTPSTRRRAKDDEEDDDDEMLSPDDVEADLDTILKDRMVTVEQTFDGERGRCLVHKLGPILTGEAEFTVAPGDTPDSAVVHWREDVHVPYLPGLLSTLTGRIGALLFRQAIGRMERLGRRTS